MRRVSTQSRKFVLQRRLRMAAFSAASIASAALVVWGASWVASWDMFQIREVRVSGIEGSRVDRVRATAVEALQGEYFGIFPRSSSLIYPQEAVRRSVLEGFPEIASVSASRKGLKALEIEVTERAPSAIVCAAYPDWQGDHIALSDPDGCYFVDEQGRVFGVSPSFSGGVYHLYYAPDLSSGPEGSIPIGAEVAEGKFAELQAFYHGASAAGIYVDALFVREDGEYELYVRNISDSGPDEWATVVIHFGGPASTSEQLSNLISFWNHMKSQRPVPSFGEITLTYPPNVYYTVNK